MSYPAAHRLRMCAHCPRPCALNAAGRIDHTDDAVACPDGRWRPYARDGGAAAPDVAHPPAPRSRLSLRRQRLDPAMWGPPLWAELHARPETCDLATEPAWLAAFARRVPCGDCRPHWLSLVRDTPPDLTSRQAYHAWSVAAHNAVNARLGRPAWASPAGA